MDIQLRLSEHSVSQQWLTQFRTSEERGLGAQLLNQLKLVSIREFETGIEHALTELQARLNSTIAVYPVTPPNPKDVLGYHPFEGGKGVSIGPSTARREQHGSEGRVAHILTGLQRKNRKLNGTSLVECAPTVTQLKTQGIQHIVLVDDVCGSGQRIAKFWKQVIPKSIKSLLSLKRLELWIVVYAITPVGRKALSVAMPKFSLKDHLISVLPETDLQGLLTREVHLLCMNYAKQIGMESAGSGYRGSACPVVFEYGCPNNLPAILWTSRRNWKGVFPNRAIPLELRSCFNGDDRERSIEALWRSNQPKLALSLLDALDNTAPLTSEHRMLLTLLGLRLRAVREESLAARLLMSDAEFGKLLRLATDMNCYDKNNAQVTPMGKELVSRFRKRFSRTRRPQKVAMTPEEYYPNQCEGKLRKLGITGRLIGGRYP